MVTVVPRLVTMSRAKDRNGMGTDLSGHFGPFRHPSARFHLERRAHRGFGGGDDRDGLGDGTKRGQSLAAEAECADSGEVGERDEFRGVVLECCRRNVRWGRRAHGRDGPMLS